MEKRRFPLVRVLVCLFFAALLMLYLGSYSGAAPDAGSAALKTRLEGYVYEGVADSLPPSAIPLSGVVVRVYGSTDPNSSTGFEVGADITGANGWYGVDFDERYPYYNIVQTDLAGYFSDGASSVGGVVRGATWIQYTIPISGSKVTTGNNFWDRRAPTPTPTSQYCLVADFSWEPLVACTNQVVQFENLSQWCPGAPQHYQQWYLGNDVWTFEANPSTTYDAAGTYTVTLTIWSDDTTSRSVSKTVTVVDCSLALHKQCRWVDAPTIHVGDLFTCTMTLYNNGGMTVADYILYDQYPADYLKYIVASPAPTSQDVWMQPDSTWLGGIEWSMPGPIVPGGWVTHTLIFGAKKEGPEIWDQAYLRFTTESGMQREAVDEDCVEIVSAVRILGLSKKMLWNLDVLPKVGDLVEFQLELENLTGATVTGAHLEDSFDTTEWELMSAFPVPDADITTGTSRTLVWQDITLAPYAKFVVHLEMKVLLAGVKAQNCATAYYPGSAAPITGDLEKVGPECVFTHIAPEQGRHLKVWKLFTVPSNHVANLGDNITFETGVINQGSEAIQEVIWYDAIVPAAVSSYLPIYASYFADIPGGSYVLWQLTFPALATASPAVNTANWEITWPDGTVETRVVSDYVYIVEGQIGRGLYIDKWREAPATTSKISDTITYKVTITNVTGVDLPVVPLVDVYPTMCLTFVGASPPPDQVLPGKLVWNNIGPLAMGSARTVDVRFHAEAACPNGLNCASVRLYSLSNVPLVAADCEPVDIQGGQPRLEVSKTRLSPSPATVGDITLWRVVVKNAGTAPLAVVPLYDGYQKNWLTYDSAVPVPATIDLANGRLDWANIGPLAAGQSVTVTLRLRAIAANVGVRNCAETRYTVGGSPVTVIDCATVDIREPREGIHVEKALLWPTPPAVLSLGDLAVFSITVRNTGMVTLTNVVVQDIFDPNCWRYSGAPGTTPDLPAPGVVKWTIATLGPGEVVSWRLLLRAVALCQPMENCVRVAGTAPQGLVVRDDMCLPVPVEPRRPGLSVEKRIVAPTHWPMVGDLVEFEIIVRNTGNTTLNVVQVTDSYSVDCLKYVNALPAPSSVDLATGKIIWNNIGPLGPGDVKALHVFLAVTGACKQGFNCVEVRELIPGAVGLMASDCVDVPVRIPQVEDTPTPTPTRPTQETPTPTATVPTQLTPTPTSTRVPGGPRLYIPLVLKLR